MDVHTLAPFEKKNLDIVTDAKLIVSIEEHSVIGGLGTIIADLLAERTHSPRLLKLGVAPEFKKAGDYEFMLEQNRLTVDMIAEDIAAAFHHNA